MKLNFFSKVTCLMAMVLFIFVNVKAQCHACTDPAPYTGEQVCGLPASSLSQPSATCLAASSCSGSSYSYTINFPSKMKAYYVYITGGVILDRYITADIISQAYTSYNCSTAQTTNEFGTSNGNVIYSVRFTIRWTSSSPKYIEVYGYTGPVNTMSANVATYSCFSIAASGSVPATPATVGLSSPICSTTPKGWLLGNQGSPGATYYTWSGAVSGTYTTVTGPFVAAGQTVNVCVAAGNACGVSAPKCASIYVPNICGGYYRQQDTDETDNTIEKQNTEAITVSPNPASGILSVYINKQGNHNISILNTSGITVLSAAIAGQKNTSLDVSKIAKGVYIVVITEKGAVTEKKKILIQ